jgi:taurine dioxygenase
MASQLLSFRPLDGPFGVEVDIELDAEVGPAAAAELRRLLAERHLLLIRSGGVTPAQQLQFVGNFAAAHGHPDTLKRLTNDVATAAGAGELLFHSDYVYLSVPLYGISLYAESVAPDSAPTTFADAALAMARLPAALRARVEGRMVLHLWERNSRGVRQVESAATVRGQGAVHPVIWKSPLSGAEVLCVNQEQSARVLGLSEADSDALLAELFQHFYQAEHLFTHRWQTGDLIIWDNLALQHSRGAGPVDGRRRLRRTTFGIEGYEHLIREVHGSPSP